MMEIFSKAVMQGHSNEGANVVFPISTKWQRGSSGITIRAHFPFLNGADTLFNNHGLQVMKGNGAW